MAETPCLYARLSGEVLEVVTDRLTMRLESGTIVAIEDHVLSLFTKAREVRVMTLDEVPWSIAEHVIAPSIARAA